jgi:malate dehydrogenase
MKKIAVTGAAGQIAYSLIFRIARGELFGLDEPIELNLIDVNSAPLEGVKMELEDCAFPLLKEIRYGSNLDDLFGDIDCAFLIGAMPRKQGMERKDLLTKNAKIFVSQGQALNRVAKKQTKVLVVGNPCNTNCLIALHHAPKLESSSFFAMSRLDQNRARSQIAIKANCSLVDISRLCVWGNHSLTQVPDFENAQIQGAPLLQKISDRKWLEESWMPHIQQRGALVIKARGASSAASAANAALDAMKSCYTPTAELDWFSMGVLGKNNSYGISPDLVFSYPCTSKGNGEVNLTSVAFVSEFLKEKLLISQKELEEERDAVRHLIS